MGWLDISSAAALRSSAREAMAYSLAEAYLTRVGAVLTWRTRASARRAWKSSRPAGSGIENEAASSSNTRADSWLTFQAGSVAADLRRSPSERTSANGLESRRAIWFSRVRALTIWPSEVK